MGGYAFRKANTIRQNCVHPLKAIHIFTFKNIKKTVYIVNVEEYDLNVFIVKFFRKIDRERKVKFNVLTKEGDARKIIYTCIEIGKSIASTNSFASFGFIGAPILLEKEKRMIRNTKRFRVYDKYAKFFFNPENYIHFKNEEYSSYLLINREYMKIVPSLDSDIDTMFKLSFDINSLLN